MTSGPFYKDVDEYEESDGRSDWSSSWFCCGGLVYLVGDESAECECSEQCVGLELPCE